MKSLLPLALAFLLAACATPEDKDAAHQRQLEKEARENFMALKAREGGPRPVRLAQNEPLTPAKTYHHSSYRAEPARRADDTIYYWDMPRRNETPSALYLAYLQQSARELAKRPEDLAPEEREWVRRHYRDPRYNRAARARE